MSGSAAPGAAGKLTGLLDDADPLVRAATAATQVDVDGAVGQRALAAWRLAVGSGGEQARWALSGAAASPSPRFLPDLIDLAATTAPPDDLATVLAAHADLLVPELAASVTSTSPAGTLDHRTTDRVLRAVTQSWSPEAQGVLQLCLSCGRRSVAGSAARALAAADRTVDSGLLGPLVEAEAGRVARAFAALAVLGLLPSPGRSDVEASSTLHPLGQALRDEIDASAINVGRLIAVTHGGRMARVVAALGGGADGDRALALEALEVTLGAELARVAVPLIDPTIDEERRRRLLVRFAPREVGDADWWLRDLAFDDGRTWQEPWLRVCALYAAPVILGSRAVQFAQSWEDCDDWVVAETARWALAEAAAARPKRSEASG